MKGSFNFNKRIKPGRLQTILFLGWFISSALLFAPSIKSAIKNITLLRHLNVEERAKHQSDDKLYRFIIFCQRQLPKEARCFFYNPISQYGQAQFFYYYDMLVASYFLYPVKAYNLSNNNIKDILESVTFILVYGMKNLDLPGYEIFARYDTDSFILKKAR